MDSMIMTLDVSKLSGWLNATACCRVEMKRGHTMWDEMRARRWEGVGRRRRKRGMHGDRARLKAVGAMQGRCGAHVKHAGHVRGAGGVDA